MISIMCLKQSKLKGHINGILSGDSPLIERVILKFNGDFDDAALRTINLID